MEDSQIAFVNKIVLEAESQKRLSNPLVNSLILKEIGARKRHPVLRVSYSQNEVRVLLLGFFGRPEMYF